MPVIRKRDAGAMSIAKATADDPAKKMEALAALHNNMYARTSIGPREAQATTWARFHVWWYGPDVPILPLTEQKVLHVSALFKSAGYKSYKNYASRMKDLQRVIFQA